MRKQESSIVREIIGPTISLTEFSPALLMEKEPTNLQAKSLGTLIDEKVTRGAFNITVISRPLISLLILLSRGVYRNGYCRRSSSSERACRC
jgi:hypothetical protein